MPSPSHSYASSALVDVYKRQAENPTSSTPLTEGRPQYFEKTENYVYHFAKDLSLIHILYDMRRLLSVDRDLWLQECSDARAYYEKIGKVPEELYEELDALEMRLNRGYKRK